MNFSQKYARSVMAAAAAAALVSGGCGRSDGTAEYEAGVKAFEGGNFNEARDKFSKSLEYGPENASAAIMLARTLVASGDLKAASAAAEKAMELAPGDADAVMTAAQTAFYARNYALARKLFGELASKPGYTPQIRSAALASLAVVDIACISGRDMEYFRESARTGFLLARRSDPRNAAARYHLALLYRDSYGYAESALDQFELYARLDRKDAARVERTRTKTIPELRETIAKNPQRSAERRDSLLSAKELRNAETARAKGDFKAARKAYERARRADALNFQAVMGLAETSYRASPTKAGATEAFRLCREAWGLRPTSKEALVKAGEYALKAGNAAGAVEAYSRALAAAPNDAATAAALANAFVKNGKRRAAEPVARYARELSRAKTGVR